MKQTWRFDVTVGVFLTRIEAEKHLDTLLAEGSMDTLGRVVFEADGQTSWWVVLDDNERLVDDLGRSTMVDA